MSIQNNVAVDKILISNKGKAKVKTNLKTNTKYYEGENQYKY